MFYFFPASIKAPKFQRVHGGKSTRSPGSVPQQSPSSQWDNIIRFLDSLMSRLRENYVRLAFLSSLRVVMFHGQFLFCLFSHLHATCITHYSSLGHDFFL